MVLKVFVKFFKCVVFVKGLMFLCICLFGGVVMLYVNFSVIGVFMMIIIVFVILFMFVWMIIFCLYFVYCK